MKENIVKLDLVGLATSWLLTATQMDDIFQIIQLVLSCISTLIVIAFTFWKWLKTAKKDGKITQEELQEGVDILEDGIDKLSNITKKGDE